MDEPKAVSVPLGPRPISWKKWVAGFIFFLLCNAGLLALSRGTPGFADVEILIILLVYMSLAFTFFPLPTAWIILWAAREIDPVSVSLVGAVGTCIANLHDYYILNYLFGLERLRKAKGTKSYKSAVKWFSRAPFATLSVASFLPLPVDVVRILTVSTGYPRRLYLLATFVGRFPRYLLLAYLGYELKLSNGAILIVLLVTVMIGITQAAVKKIKERRGGDEHDENGSD
jgi:uncharacterized membrane protein YdjX (TVP38/TMEM64 family)